MAHDFQSTSTSLPAEISLTMPSPVQSPPMAQPLHTTLPSPPPAQSNSSGLTGLAEQGLGDKPAKATARSLETKAAVLQHLSHPEVLQGLRSRPLSASLRANAMQAIENGDEYPLGRWAGASSQRSFWICSACQALDADVVPTQVKRYQHLGASIRRYLSRKKPVLCPWLHLGEHVTSLVLPSRPTNAEDTRGILGVFTGTSGRRNRFKRTDAPSINMLTNPPVTSGPIQGTTSLMPSALPVYSHASHSSMVGSSSLISSSLSNLNDSNDLSMALQQLSEVRAKKASYQTIVQRLEQQESQIITHLASFGQQLRASSTHAPPVSSTSNYSAAS
eukprot:TRINITY_DN10789_c0_g1_i5.p1 TRINITY_DN10789_c0_g1~~TRINITY_DN10789_c0_g1_i5.p1  ORF type:complete len:333 (+),score=51.26 TRINITY_DN10789_c0_g1_i5:72-1070(+)